MNISLFDLLNKVRQTIDAQHPLSYWVVAEINELKVNSSGHCYLELVEKDDKTSHLKAKVSGTIWAYTYRMLKSYFETATGQLLNSGLKVLVKGTVQFNELYGLSLNITDIDPSYTVGEMALQRQKTIAKLQEEGVFDMNRELGFPTLPKRIAIISSQQSAGYQDFMKQLMHNPQAYVFQTTLFPAVVQGKDAENAIITALESIYAQVNCFDVAVILRGGGSQSDLSCFDSYRLSYHVTQFPLPVITGIGHDKDLSVTDEVAHTSLKTPTAVADFLVGCFAEQDELLDDFSNIILNIASNYAQNKTQQIQRYESLLYTLGHSRIEQEKNLVYQFFPKRLQTAVNIQLKNMRNHQLMLEQNIKAYDPQKVLNRGYSITYVQGKLLKDAKKVKPGEQVEVVLSKGKINATID